MPKFLWTQRSNFGPAARAEHAMAFDSNRTRSVLFGGLAGSVTFADTWEWDGLWTQSEDIGPAARAGHAMAYDDAHQVTLLFGGIQGTNFFSDTWQWDGNNWTQLADSGPSPRGSASMAFDSTRKVAVLFGGYNSGGALSDTWEFDGDAWTQKQDTGPTPRGLASMCWDPTGSRIILFGGVNQPTAGPGQKYQGDTWAWNGTVWEQITDFGPPARAGAAMASMGALITLFGGSVTSGPTAAPQAFGDTWEFDGKHWAQQQDIGPSARNYPAMVFDSARSRLVLFGGAIFGSDNSGALGDTWEHIENASPSPPPPPQGSSVSVTGINLSPTSLPTGQPLTINVTLSGPAPAGGVQVTMTAVTQGQPAPMPSLPIAAGASSGSFQVPFSGAPPGQYTIVAQIGSTPSFSAVLTVT